MTSGPTLNLNAAASESASPLTGRTLGDFVVRERLGAGGGGDVYRAEQLTLGREAVIKTITRKDIASQSAQRFLREARLASQLDHPFAAHVYGFGAESDGTLWLAMELVRGVSLEQFIRERGTISLNHFVPFLERLCEVLHAAHEQGIVHRDIKPANVMVLSRAGRLLPKLLDLGIARSGLEGSELPLTEDWLTRDPSRSPSLIESDSLQLTREGALVGTPLYMAPEQWQEAAAANARSDLYSLAMLSYEAISGAPPFSNKKTLAALSAAHAFAPLPPLASELPAALYLVLSKAAAKNPIDRYDTALDFAAALRAATGLGIDVAALPQLDRSVLDPVLLDAPQPIAEAAALVEIAHTSRQQVAAIWLTRRVLIRYLALLSLAARARIGPGAAVDSDEVKGLLTRLSGEALDDGAWLQLARELLRPFALRRDAHPLPELVGFFFGRDGQTVAAGDLSWADATAVADPTREELAKLVKHLSQSLQKLTFLSEYVLVAHSDRVESWMGARRSRRAAAEVGGRQTTAGEAVLVDRADQCVLSLTPLMQVFAPSGGMAAELFMFDGSDRLGARLVALPASFERHSAEVWPWFAHTMGALSKDQQSAAVAERPPYKGLSAFTAEDADNYFGREREAEAFANRLRTSPFLAAVGPSGVGKSSFVLAGVLPLLPKDFQVLVVRPGAQPFAALANRLTAAGLSSLTADQLKLQPELLVDQLLAHLLPVQSLLIVVDQFEELLTLCSEVATRARLMATLLGVAEHPSDRFRLVITLRDDFLIAAQAIPALGDRLSSSLQLLTTPAEADLLRVIDEPARRQGYVFDDPDLPQKMVTTVARDPGALALLSFTAAQLWELRDRELKQMRARTYEAIGGVAGALAQHAEATLSAMTNHEQQLVREAFRHLVTAQGTRAVLSRKEMLELLGDGDSAKSVIEKLVTARLVVTSEAAEGDDHIELIHEALTVAWPRLVAWQHEDAENARLRDAVRASARQWDERGRPSGLLWRAEALAEYKVWRARYPGKLTLVEEAFAQASLGDEKRTRRWRQGLTLAAFVVLAIALLVIFRAYRDAKQRYLLLREEQARNELVNEHPMEALAYLADAVTGGGDTPSLRAMGGVVKFLLGKPSELIFHHADAVWNLALSDGRWLASFAEDQTIGIADLAIVDGQRKTLSSEAECDVGSFAEGGRLVVAGCNDGRVRLIDPDQAAIVARWPVGKNAVTDLAVQANGTSALVAVARDGLLAVDLISGAVTPILHDPTIARLQVAQSPDQSVVVAYHGDRTPKEFALKGLLIRFAGHSNFTPIRLPATVRSVHFANDGDRFVVGTEDGFVGVFSVKAKRWLWFSRQHKEPVFDVQFSPDNAALLAATTNEILVDTNAGVEKFRVRVQASTAIWSRDGARIFAGGRAKIIYSLDGSSGRVLFRHYAHSDWIENIILEGDHNVITSSFDGTVRRWDGEERFDRNLPALDHVLQAADNDDVLVVATPKGLFKVDPVGVVHHLVDEAIPPQAAVQLALSGHGDVVLVVNRFLRVFAASDAAVVFSMALPSSLVGLVANDDASQFGLNYEDNSIALLYREQKRVVRLAEQSSTLGFFLSPNRFATCDNSGTLNLWNSSSGEPINRQVLYKGRCLLFSFADGLASWAIMDQAKLWHWDGSGLEQYGEQWLPGWKPLGERGGPSSAITEEGQWKLMAANGTVLAALALTDGYVFSSGRLKHKFYYSDSNRHALNLFSPPEPIKGKEISALNVARGQYEITSELGIIPRAAKQE